MKKKDLDVKDSLLSSLIEALEGEDLEESLLPLEEEEPVKSIEVISIKKPKKKKEVEV